MYLEIYSCDSSDRIDIGNSLPLLLSVRTMETPRLCTFRVNFCFVSFRFVSFITPSRLWDVFYADKRWGAHQRHYDFQPTRLDLRPNRGLFRGRPAAVRGSARHPHAREPRRAPSVQRRRRPHECQRRAPKLCAKHCLPRSQAIVVVGGRIVNSDNDNKNDNEPPGAIICPVNFLNSSCLCRTFRCLRVCEMKIKFKKKATTHHPFRPV